MPTDRATARVAMVVTLAALTAGTAHAQTAAAPAASPTLAAVKARGVLNCGVIGSSANSRCPTARA